MSFAVLFVCTGNICRSPLAERLLRARLDVMSAVTPSSAGTRALVGYGMDRGAAYVLRELGGDEDGFVASQLSDVDIAMADLILTAATMHRSAVIQADPAAMHRTFTMREFGRLAVDLGAGPAGVGREQLRQWVAQVAAQRGLSHPPAPGEDEIADPLGAPLPVMRECGRLVSDAVDVLVRALGA